MLFCAESRSRRIRALWPGKEKAGLSRGRTNLKRRHGWLRAAVIIAGAQKVKSSVGLGGTPKYHSQCDTEIESTEGPRSRDCSTGRISEQNTCE